MKRFFLTFLFCFFVSGFACSAEEAFVQTYSDDGLNFGLQVKGGEKITKPVYKKLIRLGDNAWIIQKGTKYGIINNDGKIMVKPKYRHADRYFGKYVKLGNDRDYGVYDECGNALVKPEYEKIELLYGKMFLTCKKYKFGIIGFDGKVLLDNEFDDIYMPNFTTMRIKYKGEWFEIKKGKDDRIDLPDNVAKVRLDNNEYTVTHIITNTGVISGYSAVTLTDFLLKMISSISPAYEDTIDDLMLSHGVDTISIFMGMRWILDFPGTYARKYYYQLANPQTGPLSDMRSKIIQNLK